MMNEIDGALTVKEWVKQNNPKKEDLPIWDVAEISMNDAWGYMPTPDALLRGGGFNGGTIAGPLAVLGGYGPSGSFNRIGFRCAGKYAHKLNSWADFCNIIRQIAVYEEILRRNNNEK
jgi:hypothetical protein